MTSWRRILVAVDGGPTSAHVARQGAELARGLGAELALVHVGTASHPDRGRAVLDSTSEAVCHATTPRLLLRFGFPLDEIARAAVEWKADVVVVGGRRLTEPWQGALGVGAGLLARMPCTVLVVAPGAG